MSDKPHLLFLCHRIPYPPNKGDKIRSFNFLKRLSEFYRVNLACFIDDPADKNLTAELQEYCEDVFAPFIEKRWRTLLSTSGFLHDAPLSVAFYRCRKLEEWIEAKLNDCPDSRVLVFSSAMTQFVPQEYLSRTVIDFVDVDSDKWAQYARSKPFPLSWVYRRESRTLLEHDLAMAQASHSSVFVSQREADFFVSKMQGASPHVTFVSNGVDTDYFLPSASIHGQIPNEKTIVFVGAMDYWANVDAVSWYAREVFPGVLSKIPEAQLCIVGSNPTAAVKALASASDNIEVTGRVEDVRPYVLGANLVIAPLRIARGIQNKVLEAMSCAKPVLCTSFAIEGIGAESVHVADTAAEQIKATISLLCADTHAQGEENRSFVLNHFAWEHSVKKLVDLLEDAYPTST